MNKGTAKKTIVLGIIMLFVGTSVLPNISNCVSATSIYNLQNAVNYAETWWNNRNPVYCNYDCMDHVNFVSQCLIAGGFNLNDYPNVDTYGCIVDCANLNDYLVNYLFTQHETRSRSQVEPLWFLPGDVAVFGDNSDPWQHAAFAVAGDATNYATCVSHGSGFLSFYTFYNARFHIQEFFNANPSFTLCTYYHIDSIEPSVDSFSVSPSSVSLGGTFTISYTVSDTGGSGLKQAELWRKITGGEWQIIETDSVSGAGNGPYSGYFYDAPSAAGSYWYGIHVLDKTNNWAPENSPINVEVVGDSGSSITFYTTPPDGGTIYINTWGQGGTYANGQSMQTQYESYYISAQESSNYYFTHWSSTGDLTVDEPFSQSTHLSVSGSGTLTAWYMPFGEHLITLQWTFDCGEMAFNGVKYNWDADVWGKSLGVNAGVYPIVATPLIDFVFGYWITTGDLSVADPYDESTTVSVSGPGTLTMRLLHRAYPECSSWDIDFGIHFPGWTESQTFEIWSSGFGTLIYTISENIPWITISPSSGSSTGEHDVFTISVINTDTMSGYYDDYIEICYDNNTKAYAMHVYITIQGENQPPNPPTNPIPADNAINVNLNPLLSVVVSDPDGDSMDVTFYDESDGSIIGIDYGVSSGGTAGITWSGLYPEAAYVWGAIANDGMHSTQSSPWYFITKSNRNPDIPINPNQFLSNGERISVGGAIDESSIIFKSTITDADDDLVKLQIELRRLDELNGNFDENEGVLKESNFVQSNSEVTYIVDNLIPSDYHWRARTIDENGAKSDWVDFGNNIISDTDFKIVSEDDDTARIINIDPEFGASGIVTRIYGENFNKILGHHVYFDALSANIISWSDTEIFVNVPWPSSIGERTVDVKAGDFFESNSVKFTFKAPILDSIYPLSGEPDIG